ncbi:MAG TPA: toll/interleukin-1 receptor domain-containing protein [Chthoniobacterales bacterium]|jgi:hypothetical protein|nr:toll/interleukin-1 receptor domain-containing protein [Chthoniobacterales bacterium]
MAHEVFISHAYKDKGIASAICGKLESANVRCWIAPRNISAGEDWAKAIRKAIDSSRVVVLVLSENANAATHIEREIANAFYTGRIIMPFRLDNAIPRRNFLSYLDTVRWFDSVNPPAEQNLQAFTARLKDMLIGLPLSHSKLASPEAIKGAARLNQVNSCEGASRISRYRISRILKWLAVPASVVVVALLLARASQQSDNGSSLQGTDLQSVFHGKSASPVQRKEDALSTPRYTFSRLGLWVAASPSPTPSAPSRSQEMDLAVPEAASVDATPPASSLDQNAGTREESDAVAGNGNVRPIPGRPGEIVKRGARHRAKPSLKAHDRRASASNTSRFRKIRGWLTTLWRKLE